MVRSKPSSSKKPKGGVDFKKIKRKIGRKLPPPKNATNTEIKSKAIVLPEQSMAADRGGLAVNKRGLTLAELLNQTSHHNVKIRKAALHGLKELFIKYPSELMLHKPIIERLCLRMCDSDRVVRDILYHLLKTVIFPSLKEDIPKSTIEALIKYIIVAMTHISVDIRLTAFKFLELVIANFPSSFFMSGSEVLDNYADILKNSQIHIHDKSKLKSILGALTQCLSLLSSKVSKEDGSNEQEQSIAQQRLLFAFRPSSHEYDSGTSSIVKKLEDVFPLLVNCFRESASLVDATSNIDDRSYDCLVSCLQCINLATKILHDMEDFAILGNLQKLSEVFPFGQKNIYTEKEDDRFFILNVKVAEILLLSERISQSVYLLEFIENFLLRKAGTHSSPTKAHVEKHFGPLLPFIPGIILKATESWKARLLEAFTFAFKDCKADSKLILGFLSAINEMLISWNTTCEQPASNCSDLLFDYQITWMRELPRILLQLGDKHVSVSKAVLNLLSRIGQTSSSNTHRRTEYDNLQWQLKEFYAVQIISGTISYGPFLKHPPDSQELAISCFYHLSNIGSDFLESLTSCCLCNELEPSTLHRIIEVLQSSYERGYLDIAGHLDFLATLVVRFRVYPEKYCIEKSDGKVSNRRTYMDLCDHIFECFKRMGDTSLVLEILWKKIIVEMSLMPPMDNMNGLLGMIAALDNRTGRFPEEDVNNLSRWISFYMVDATLYVPENIEAVSQNDENLAFKFYLMPCISLLRGNHKLCHSALELLNSFMMDDNSLFPSRFDVSYSVEPSRRVHAAASIVLFLCGEMRLQRALRSSKSVIKTILQNMQNLLGSDKFARTIEEKHKIQCAFDQLKKGTSKLQCLDADKLRV
ncbi:testis-expressed sequence 10 protein-like isoform X2 [Ananas comosus]|uniref:Testis-expressed sequence 10 protein-like isoform X2 n=1 Tax=Ananas comosus TaxID=4615 RepID=A0A6P5EYR3_ANACO|nr:testis-expressed sequence 10 protein-like isoform X2 [Ananas comosus]